jgi:hypothetical protein
VLTQLCQLLYFGLGPGLLPATPQIRIRFRGIDIAGQAALTQKINAGVAILPTPAIAVETFDNTA